MQTDRPYLLTNERQLEVWNPVGVKISELTLISPVISSSELEAESYDISS